MADDNPFADPASINPFADPAVTAATSTVPAEDDYNPFSEENKQTEPEPIRLPPPPTKDELKAEKEKEKAAKAAKEREKKEAKKREKERAKKTFEPAIMEPEEPPGYTPAPSSFKNREDDELKKREEEISRREKDLQNREKNIERLGASGEPLKNFPPFPKCCPSPLRPCFYISVKTEIPPSEHWKMYALLALLIYLWVLLLINLVLAIAGAIVAGTAAPVNVSVYLATMGVSIAYLILFAPGAFFCWFLPVYYAYKKDSSLAFMWFFFVMAFQILSFLLGALGPPNLGACGWYNGGLLFTNTSSPDGVQTPGQIAVAVMFIIMGFLWFIAIIPSLLLLIMIHKYYRSSGGSINKAVTEGVSGAAKNEAVRGAMKSTVKAGVNTALTSNEN